MIAIIDYDAGNIKSVEKALQFLNEDVVITRDKDVILGADGVILPGVGAFGDAMARLDSYGLTEVIKAVVERQIPFLGICLGMQLMFESSEEAPGVEGLNILPGVFEKIPEDSETKVPQIGWNDISLSKRSRIFDGLQDNSYVYFVHSYYLKASVESDVAATTEYGVHIHAAVERGNVFGCQFHPEKSSEVGLMILKNFVAITKGLL